MTAGAQLRGQVVHVAVTQHAEEFISALDVVFC